MDYSIINKYLVGEASETEVRDLFEWIDSDPENRKEFIQYKKAWALTAKTKGNQDGTWNLIYHKLARPKKNLTTIQYWMVAAGFLLVFGLGVTMQYILPQKLQEQFSYLGETRIEVPLGQMSNVVLPDGTHIWLNSNSQICYKLKDEGKLRSVEIKGEAFFDVAKKKNIPFEVLNGNIQVKVFGTRFNFKSEGSDVQVTLEEGSLGIYNREQKEIARLVPGVQAVVSQSGILSSLEKVDPASVSEWKTGTYEFRNESLDVIAHRMTEIYGINIIIADKVLEGERFRCVINSKRSVLHTLELLKQTSDIDYSIKGSEVILRKKY